MEKEFHVRSRKKKKMIWWKKLLIIVPAVLVLGVIVVEVSLYNMASRIQKVPSSIETIAPEDVTNDTDFPEDYTALDPIYTLPGEDVTFDFPTNNYEDPTNGNEPAPTQPGPTQKDPFRQLLELPVSSWNQTGETLPKNNLINILLVGQDKRPGEPRQRSDSMILVSINPNTWRVSMISFMRDSYVYIPGYSENRLNAAYEWGGFPLLYSTLRHNYGIEFDGGVEVDFGAFKKIITMLGGVDLELTAAEAQAIEIGTEAKKYHLTAEYALRYSRLRKIDNDFQRTLRQRKLLTAVFNQLKAAGAGKALEVVNGSLQYITTDMSNGTIVNLANRLAANINNLKVSNYRIPVDWSYLDVMRNQMAVLQINLPANRFALKYYYLPF